MNQLLRADSTPVISESILLDCSASKDISMFDAGESPIKGGEPGDLYSRDTTRCDIFSNLDKEMKGSDAVQEAEEDLRETRESEICNISKYDDDASSSSSADEDEDKSMQLCP